MNLRRARLWFGFGMTVYMVGMFLGFSSFQGGNPAWVVFAIISAAGVIVVFVSGRRRRLLEKLKKAERAGNQSDSRR